jgi:serine/threonine protein kinase/tetratricopeptide (TPR) repeat protein
MEADPMREAAGGAAPIESILAEFSSRWHLGETPSIEEYLARLGHAPTSDAAVLIYHAFCLAEAEGLNPDPADFIARFSAQGPALEQLFSLHQALATAGGPLPEPGDAIGPFQLVRLLGEGGFARVFLAEQANLDGRLVVAKVSSRITLEPRLLARARHPNIVEVLSHHESEDGSLQVICMPFLGGATLAALLANRKLRGNRPRSGWDLLAELDQVSAPEYPAAAPGPARPARVLLANLSYSRAAAWIIARLACALDAAYARGVLHGDVKPSNVLLTAAGEPMLLDFNLAIGWRTPGGDHLPRDAGGTMAYMAPERLRALAEARQAVAPGPRAADRHCADVYALGMVLLELLTGRIPEEPGRSAATPRARAAALARSRQQGAGGLIRMCRAVVAPELQSILKRSLAPDSADRYQRASELAADLDCFCSDRPLAFARAPGQPSALFRCARRHRRVAATGVICLAVFALGALGVQTATRGTRQDAALARLARLWDAADSTVFPYRWLGRWRAVDHDAPEEAFEHLAYYNVLGSPDWRSGEEFRALPEAEQLDLEIWMLEQSLRAGRGMAQRPDAPGDWRRGLEALERVTALRPLGPLETQRRALRRQLGLADPATDTPVPTTSSAPRWMEEYLLGVEVEPLRAEEALIHYGNVLRERPESFWAHYRAAAMAHRKGNWATAIDHLRQCIARRPENSKLRTELAGCLAAAGDYDAALAECDRALRSSPDEAQAYGTRALIRSRLRQGDDARTDLKRYELLTRHAGRVPLWRLRLEWVRMEESTGAGALGVDESEHALAGRILAADPDDVDLRTTLAIQLQRTGRVDEALAEYNRILALEPDHLPARYARGTLLYNRQLGAGEPDLTYLIEHPRIAELVHESTAALAAFYAGSSELLYKGATDKALQVASQGLSFARGLDDRPAQGKMHYALARVYALSARTAPEKLQQAAAHLLIASHYDRGYMGDDWFGGDSFFTGQRAAIAQLMPELPDSVPVD